MTIEGGFDLNGISIADFGIQLRYSPNVPMLAGTLDRTSSPVGINGTKWFGSKLDALEFRLPCHFITSSMCDLDTVVRTFVEHLLDVDGQPRLLRLRFDWAPTIVYYVRYAGSLDLARGWIGATIFEIPFVADSPAGFAESLDLTALSGLSNNYLMSVNSNAGNISTPCKICLTNDDAITITGGVTFLLRTELKN